MNYSKSNWKFEKKPFQFECRLVEKWQKYKFDLVPAINYWLNLVPRRPGTGGSTENKTGKLWQFNCNLLFIQKYE